MAHLLKDRPSNEIGDGSVVPESDPVLEVAAARKQEPRGAPLSLILGGFVAFTVTRWARIGTLVTPAVGLSAQGSGSWTRKQVYVWGAVGPSVIALGASFVIIAISRHPTGILVPGVPTVSVVVTVLCCAWFALLPAPWPLGVHAYSHAASASATLEDWLAVATGPGVLLTPFGGFTLAGAGREARVTK